MTHLSSSVQRVYTSQKIDATSTHNSKIQRRVYIKALFMIVQEYIYAFFVKIFTYVEPKKIFGSIV